LTGSSSDRATEEVVTANAAALSRMRGFILQGLNERVRDALGALRTSCFLPCSEDAKGTPRSAPAKGCSYAAGARRSWV
jgi:hypothetical protein